MKKKLFDLSDKFRAVRIILAHITIAFAVLVITCFVIDRVNNAMEFMTSDISKWMIAVLALLALVSSVLTVVALWSNPDK